MADKVIGDYYLGLDVGTSSVGWAVTDTDYNILEYRRKATWGVHLFDEGKTNRERRIYKMKRNYFDRKRHRIILLQELFSEEISKIDPYFFDRLDESGLFVDDRKYKQKNSIFNDCGFNDSAYHRMFPTVYHLRKFLMTTESKPDLRFVYLALHHILKYRGHFFYGELDSDNIPNIKDAICSLNNALETLGMRINNLECIEEIISDHHLTILEKYDCLFELLNYEDIPSKKQLINLLIGSKCKLEDLFGDISLKGFSISFNDSDIQEKMNSLDERLDLDYILLIIRAKVIYDWSLFSSSFREDITISDLKIEQYNQHKCDLALLKDVIREYSKEQYWDMFKNSQLKGNYCSYVGKCGNQKINKTCTQEEFCKYCLGIFSRLNLPHETYGDMLSRLSDYTFLPKQVSDKNSIIPQYVHRKELKIILDNVSRFYPFMIEPDFDGYTIVDKVLMIHHFKVPYYVGPIGKGATHSWVVRKVDNRLLPWNYSEIIDDEASKEAFIENMTGFCSYIVGEKVLPRNSIIYSYFVLYNELNGLRVDGEKLSVDIKNKIVEDLFEKKLQKVTKNKILTYLKQQNYLNQESDHVISGTLDSKHFALRSLFLIKNIIGNKIKNIDLCEEIIRICTIFKDSSNISLKLQSKFGHCLDKTEIESLSHLSFDGWGKLSKKFLMEIYDTDQRTGKKSNIICLLKSTQNELKLIYNDYSFRKQVEDYNFRMTDDKYIDYSFLNDLYLSPSSKKSVWRMISVVKDIVCCIGHEPKKIFVETTQKSVKTSEYRFTKTRKESLLKKYISNNEDEDLIQELMKTDECDLKNRSLYLYFTQLGRCMYCGRTFKIEDLHGIGLVDRDHIYPRSKIKDDSIHNNIVLSCKECNSSKADRYPISISCQRKMKPFWNDLKNRGYINNEKFSRLVRTSSFDEYELQSYLRSQFVSTSQAAVVSVNILKYMFSDKVQVVGVSANSVTEFRNIMGFIKCKSVNDYHHAKDAYLNIIVGNVFTSNFSKLMSNSKIIDCEFNPSKIYNNPIFHDEYEVWVPGEEGTKSTISKYMRRDNILFTKYQEICKGKLFDDNPSRANKSLYCRKSYLPSEKYGGYNNVGSACYSLIEYDGKAGKERSIEVLNKPDLRLLNNINELSKYYSERLGKNVKIVIPIIRMNSLFEFNGFRMTIKGRTGDRIVFYPAVQLLLPDQQYSYCKKIYKYIENYKSGFLGSAENYGITILENLDLFNVLYNKCNSKPFIEVLENFKNNLEKIDLIFRKSDVDTQALVLNEILHTFQCNALTSNLKKVGGPAVSGRLTFNKKFLCKNKNIYLINQSVSGLYENKILISLP